MDESHHHHRGARGTGCAPPLHGTSQPLNEDEPAEHWSDRRPATVPLPSIAPGVSSPPTPPSATPEALADGGFGALLDPGTYTVAAWSQGKKCPPQTVTVTAGQVTDLTIECPIN